MERSDHIQAIVEDIPATDFQYSGGYEKGPKDHGGENETKRGNWTGRFNFLLSLLGYSVGLGNVWRFPYLCFNNGGGTFLIPFTVMLIVVGLPLLFMELSFGQYAALGPVAAYDRFCPLFRGLGYGMVIVSSIVTLYYNVIIAWTIYYMAVSFISISYQLPWQNCDAEWSTKNCYSYKEADECKAKNGTYYLRQCLNESYAALQDTAALADVALRKPPTEEYFTNKVLGLSSGIEEIGQVRWFMAVCLFAAWLIVFLCNFKGVQSSGKVVYFTALFPYVVFVILFFRSVTLPGASTGILFYLTPDFSQLANVQVWEDAVVQTLLCPALSPGWGGLITLSSYNNFSNNCYTNALIVAVSNIVTSFFAGLVIFSVIGFLAHELNMGVDCVVGQGAGAFVVYPEVVTRLSFSPLWSILFFGMLLALGLDSQFALMETVSTAILDRFPNFRQNKEGVLMTVALFGYLGGLIFTTNSGMYWLQLMDKYAANWSVLIMAFGECILIAWIYGAEKFCHDIQGMIGRKSKLWVIFWSVMWRIITPAALMLIMVLNWIVYKPLSYGHYVYPMWAEAVGWTIGVLPVVVVVLMAVHQTCSGSDDLTILEKVCLLLRPTEEWRPAGTKCALGTPAKSVMRTEPELSPPVMRECSDLPHLHPLVVMQSADNTPCQDKIETTCITGSVENEVRKAAASPKPKHSSIRSKIPNFNDDSDDTVNELHFSSKNDVSELYQNAKVVTLKSKTDQKNELSDNIHIISQVQNNSPTTSTFSVNITFKSVTVDVASVSTSVTVPMNTNIFGDIDTTTSKSTKSSLIVEIDNTKSSAYSPSPLIFTTAKIHTDNITKEMEPLHVTPVPILSTIEGNVIKSIPSILDSSEKYYDAGKSKSESQPKCSNETD
ncbi:PREDICTED: sodium- and chloride-dependent glycine transporter 1-like [Papilio xuthus]|uniref:Transporter n=1 Tax=Papilio xuthus TaxID=66420 RepID=A0AAJ6ZM26_PAPXU|nr:PREDICTED: sodium- and chloride-dependent glycine transporter 1-like [Papilio xuthus]